jgi:hypothetical protein
MPTTPAQRRLIELLVNELASGSNRWERANEIARRYATDHRQLLLTRDWTGDFLLDITGQVWMIDTETGQPARSANASEHRSALFQGLMHYPELHSLLPNRPTEAETCTVCEGTGVPEIVLTKPPLRNLVCECGGAGWTVRDATSPAR